MSKNSDAGIKAEPFSHQLGEVNPAVSTARCLSNLDSYFTTLTLAKRTCLLDLVRCNRHAISGYRTLSHYDHIQTRTSGPLLEKTEDNKIHLYILNYIFVASPSANKDTHTSASLLHRWFSQSSSGGISGINTQSAPQDRAVTRARYLQTDKHTHTRLL